MGKDVIVVTGSCGRIGTAVVKRLAETYAIAGFELPKVSCGPNNQEIISVDLSSESSVHQACMHVKHVYGGRIASVIHLAAYYSFAEKNSIKYDQITVKGTERLLAQLKHFEVEQFIFTSTMLIHKPTKVGRPIREDSEIEGTWGYPQSKIDTEKLIHEKRGKMPVVLLRIAGVYDDECHSIPISHQIQRIYEKDLNARLFSGDIHHGAAFVHMNDVVDAIALCVEKREELPSETALLIGESQTLSYDQMQREISRLLFNKEFTTVRVPKWFAKFGAWVLCLFAFKKQPFIRPWMISIADDHYELNTTKAQKLLGWRAKHSVAKTLPIMIEKLKQDPERWYKINQL